VHVNRPGPVPGRFRVQVEPWNPVLRPAKTGLSTLEGQSQKLGQQVLLVWMLLFLRKEGKARWSGSGSVTDLVQQQ
jgi:hypothetical protein